MACQLAGRSSVLRNHCLYCRLDTKRPICWWTYDTLPAHLPPSLSKKVEEISSLSVPGRALAIVLYIPSEPHDGPYLMPKAEGLGGWGCLDQTVLGSFP